MDSFKLNRSLRQGDLMLPYLFVHNLWILEGVCGKIDGTICKFILVNDHCHCMDLNTITLPKASGGLGICLARDFNISLFGKHVWHMFKRNISGGYKFWKLNT